MNKNLYTLLAVFVVALMMVLSGPGTAPAHCDGLDGPVIVDAKEALESGDVNLILIWVQKKDEGKRKKAFQKTLAVRKLNPEAKELADMYFFETLVLQSPPGIRRSLTESWSPYTDFSPKKYTVASTRNSNG